MRARLLVLVLPLLMGCNLLQLTPTSQVIRTRIAGIQAEPAEIGVGDSTTLTALMVHPDHPAPEMGMIWFSCLEAGGATGCLGFDPEDLPEDGEEVDPTGFQFQVGSEFVYTATGPDLEEAWAALEPADRVEGLTVLVSVNLVRMTDAELELLFFDLFSAFAEGNTERAEALGAELADLIENGISAARRVVVSDKTAGDPSAVDCPVTELLPNVNPSLDGLVLHIDEEGKDAGFPLGNVIFVDPGATLTLRPVVSVDSVEDYLYITTDGVTECRDEDPWFAWITNGGAFTGDYSFVADEEDLEEVTGRPKINRLTLVEDELFGDQRDLWLVVRDRRGGLDWNHWTLLPQSLE